MNRCRYCHAEIGDQEPRRYYRGQPVDTTVCNICRWDEAVDYSGVEATDARSVPR